MKKDVLIVHYNTPELTEAAILSLNRSTPDCNVVVFDNSDERPFTTRIGNVSIIDNTRGREIDFQKFLAGQPRKVENPSRWGSAKHCMSVDLCLDILEEGFLLMDSDVLMKKDVSPLFDERYPWVGGVHTNTLRYGVNVKRVIPFLCYINVPILKRNGIRYFNKEKMWFLNDKIPDMFYDTGAWLLEACRAKGLDGKMTDITEYALHFRHGSWKDKDAKIWLNENKELWIY